MKKTDFNILLFLALYFTLKYAFYFYVGFTTPGGRLFFSFPARYLNFPYWLTVVVAKSATSLLEICGYAAHQRNAANVTIGESRGVTIAWGCLGVAALSLWTGFIAAHRARALYKLKWMVAGFVLIFMVNILRIAMIALSNYRQWSYFESFNAHTSFDTLTYAVILVLMLVFVLNYNSKKVRTG